VVLKRLVEVGTLVAPGTPGFILADTSSVKVVFGVPDTMMGRMKLGDEQRVTTEAVSGGFSGKISAISPSADPKSRVFSVEVTLPNKNGRLKAGMVATLILKGTGTRTAVPAIPLSAVVRSPADPNGYAVFVVEDRGGKSVARIRSVELGEAFGNLIGVKAGLSPAERVITTGATLVRDGGKVEVIP
jgi:multidrug efflux system membrane fusion protein